MSKIWISIDKTYAFSRERFRFEGSEAIPDDVQNPGETNENSFKLIGKRFPGSITRMGFLGKNRKI
jgi:hypothetical protein